MSQLQIPTKGLRKRLSSEALGGDESRQRVADLPAKKEMGMSDMLAEINGIKEEVEATKQARRKSEEQAKEDGKRVEKTTRKRKQRDLQNPVLTEPGGEPRISQGSAVDRSSNTQVELISCEIESALQTCDPADCTIGGASQRR